MASLPIIETAHLFAELDGQLIALLKSLSRDDWRRTTVVPKWNVHQVSAHLLDTALRRLSMCRDGWQPRTVSIGSEAELVVFVNQLNAQGVETLGRMSPELLIAATELVAPQLAAYLASLDPVGPAAFAVSWAGEPASENWFDVAREFTERWHHQQQIRLATDRPGIMTPRLYGPVLDTFMRVLPHTYRDVDAHEGTACDFIVPGACGGRWRIGRRAGRWELVEPDDRTPAAVAVIPEDLAWRLFTKGLPADQARERITLHGDTRLASVVCHALAIVG